MVLCGSGADTAQKRLLGTIHRVRGAQAGLLSTRQCERAGVGTATRTRLVRSGRWRRATRGVHAVGGAVPAPRSTSQEWSLRHQRQVWAGLLAAPDDAMPVGLSALAVHGIWGLPRVVGSQVVYGPGRRAAGAPGVRVRKLASSVETEVVGERRVPTLVTTMVHTLPEVGRDLAVVLLDNALNRELLTDDLLAEVRARVRGRRGAASLRAVWPLVDGRAASPIETRARLECHDHGIVPDGLQVPVTDADGCFLGCGDLGWRRADGGWLIAEMNGVEVHEGARALARDRPRQNALVTRSRTTVLRFGSIDLGTGRIPRDVRAARDAG